jgi:hypothetical protein
MGLILSEPIKKVVEILKILSKMSVEDAKIHPKRPYALKKVSPTPSAQRPLAGPWPWPWPLAWVLLSDGRLL